MNRELTLANLLLGAASVLALLAIVAWAFAPALVTTSGIVRLAFVAAVAVVCIPAVAWGLGKRIGSEAAARQAFDSLSRCEPGDFDDENLAVSPLPASHPWSGILHRLRQLLAEQSRRLNDAEHARARAEIRSQRLTAERKQLTEILSALGDPVLAI